MGARAYSSDNQPTYNKNSVRVPIYISKDHFLQNKDRPYYAEDKDAAQALLAHIESVLTGDDNRAARAYWNELNQIVKNGYNATEHAKTLEKRNGDMIISALNDSGDILSNRQIDALYIYSTERAVIRKELSERLNAQDRGAAMRAIQNMAVNNTYGEEGSLKGLNPKIAKELKAIEKTESYQNIVRAVAIIDKDIDKVEDAMDIAPLTSDTRFANEINDENYVDQYEEDAVMSPEVRRQRLERILRSALDIDLGNERVINTDNIRLAQAYSSLMEQINVLENGGEEEAARLLHGRLVSAERLAEPINNTVEMTDGIILANSIISGPAYQAFAGEVEMRTQAGEKFKDILSTASASENDPLSRLDIIAETRQEAQVFSHILDAVSMNGSRLPEPEKIRAITAQIRDDLSVAVYQRSPSPELSRYPKMITLTTENRERYKVAHPYWEQYASGSNTSRMTETLAKAIEVARDAHGDLMREKMMREKAQDNSPENQERLEKLKTVNPIFTRYLAEQVGYVPMGEYKPIQLSTPKLLFAPIFGPESHKLKFNTIAIEAARYFKNEDAIKNQIAGYADFNKNAESRDRISLVIVKDDEHKNKNAILEAAKAAGMPIVDVTSTQTRHSTVDMSTGVPRTMSIRENKLFIEKDGEKIDLYSSEGQKMTRGAVIVVNPTKMVTQINALGQKEEKESLNSAQKSMIGWQVSQSLSRETLVFGITDRDYNVCQQVRRSVELAKPTTVLSEDGEPMKINEAYAIAKEGAPRTADNNRPTRMSIPDYNDALNWKLESPEGKLFMNRIIGYEKAINIAENYRAIDKVSGRERDPVVNDLVRASKLSFQELKAMSKEEEANIRRLYDMTGAREIRQFSQVDAVESAIQASRQIMEPTIEKIAEKGSKQIIDNPVFNQDYNINIDGDTAKRVGKPVIEIGFQGTIEEIGRPKIAIIGSGLREDDKSTIEKIDQIVSAAAKNKQTIGIMEDSVGNAVIQAADKHGANLVMVRANALDTQGKSAPMDLSISSESKQAFEKLQAFGSAVVLSTNLKPVSRVSEHDEDRRVDEKGYVHKGDSRRLSDIRTLTTLSDSVVVAIAEEKDLTIYAAATAGQSKYLDKNAGKSVAVIIPDSDVKSISKYAGNLALARENGTVSVRTGTTSTTAFAHSTGGVTDATTGLFVDAQREQTTSAWASPTYSTASWSQPAKALSSENQINDYVKSVADGTAKAMQSNIRGASLSSEAIRLATIEKASDTTEKMARIYTANLKTPDPDKKTPDQEAGNDNANWRNYVKDVHAVSGTSMRIKSKDGMEM